jgi:hypothetical protein
MGGALYAAEPIALQNSRAARREWSVHQLQLSVIMAGEGHGTNQLLLIYEPHPDQRLK